MDLKTPLYDRHVALGGKIVPFAGFLLPVQFPKGILEEHKIVREHVGMFDCSHMGEALVEGPDALTNLDYILTNRFDDMAIGGCRYSIMLYEDGGCVDDLIVYRRGQDRFLIILNAANAAKDVSWMKDHIKGNAVLTDISSQMAQIALQGADAQKLLTQIASGTELPTKYYTFAEHVMVAGVDCLVSRTGYTGEYGYEIFMKNEGAVPVWDALLAAGAEPCGLGSRDTLRLEAGMPLYGHEISEVIDPLTAGLGSAVKMDKEDFIGKSGLLRRGTPKRKRVGLKVTGRGVIREHQEVYDGDRLIGETSSGTYLPWVGVSCAMAYLDLDKAVVGNHAEVDVRGRRVPVEVVPLPFFSRTRKK